MTHDPHLPHDDDDLHGLVTEIAARATVAVGLAGIALIHLLDSIGKWSETRYLFWMYIALDGRQPRHRRRRPVHPQPLSWLAAAGVAASALVGFVVNRTVGLPNAMDDIGNWTEPLGLASLFVEGAVMAVSLAALAATRSLGRRAPAVAAATSRRHDPPRASEPSMYDDAGFLTLSLVSALAIVGTFAGLFWAAIQDGRDERAFRLRGR